MTEQANGQARALAQQIEVWDRMAGHYAQEIDRRFATIVSAVVRRAAPAAGEVVVDVGTGSGAVALAAAELVLPGGRVLAVDPSPEMRALAAARAAAAGRRHVQVLDGRAEALTVDTTADVVTASLSLMFAVDRAAAAREFARVLKPGGRLVAAVWAGPATCDIVRFQQLAASQAPAPPVAGVGPAALADPAPFLSHLAAAGMRAGVERELHEFTFDNFAAAWQTLAAVTTANLSAEQQAAAQQTIQAAMWPAPDQPRTFRNEVQFITGVRQG